MSPKTHICKPVSGSDIEITQLDYEAYREWNRDNRGEGGFIVLETTSDGELNFNNIISVKPK